MTDPGADGAPLTFAVDPDRVAAVGRAQPGSAAALSAYEVHGLASHERLYHQLIEELAPVTAVFRPGERMAVAGQEVVDAYLVREGLLSAQVDGRTVRIGAGSVIGLAEGLAETGHRMSVVADSVVTVSVIPLHQVLRALQGMHRGLRGITRSTVMRILQLPQAPEALR